MGPLNEIGGGYGDGGDGGGFGAEDARAEGDGLPLVGREEGHLFGSPAAFGADGEGGVGLLWGGLCVEEGGGDGGGLLGFAEENAGGALFLFEGLFEGDGVGDLGDGGAAGLLGGFKGNAAPALDAFGGGLGEVLFCAAGEDGGDAGYAQLGGFFDGPFHVIELEDGEEEMKWERGVGLELFVEGEVDFGVAYRGDFGAVEEAVGYDVVGLAGFGAEDSGEMNGLVADEGGCGWCPEVGDEASAGHVALLVGLRVGDRVLAGIWDGDGEGALVVEVDVEGGRFSGVPHSLSDGEVEKHHTLCGLAGGDECLAEQRGGGQVFERGEGAEEGRDVLLFGGVGMDLFAVGGDERGGEVFEEDRKVEAIFDAQRGEDVEIVLGAIAANEDCVRFKDGVGRVYRGLCDCDVCCLVRCVAHDQSNGDAKDRKRDEDRREEIVAGGLGEGRLRHFCQSSKSELYREICETEGFLL